MDSSGIVQGAGRRSCSKQAQERNFSPPNLVRVASGAFAAAGNHRFARKCEKIGRKLDNVSKVIDHQRFETSLDGFLPQPSKGATPIRKQLRDAQFRQLADFCNQAGYPQWALRPRTFAVLRMIGHQGCINSFIEAGLKDISLPYNDGNLPGFLKGQARRYFLDCQNYVLNGRASALERFGEAHQHVDGSADDYFVYVEDLGAGSFGQVDSVIGEMSLMKFARKRINRRRLFTEDRARLKVFENELETLKSLSHRHLVQLVGSYTDSSCVGLIMTPVADMNLATYLKRSERSESTKICLRRFFGCLATALSYLHSQHVQHKDIKPENILVKQQNVYLTDFGTSRSWDGESAKTTQGTVVAFTPRYCAPEVVQFGSSRNEFRDIWSLGCVFLEMCSVLADNTVEEMYQFLKINGTRGEFIRENTVGTKAWAEKVKADFFNPQDRQPLELGCYMCTVDQSKRPSAKELLSTIANFEDSTRYHGLCCDSHFYSNNLSRVSSFAETSFQHIPDEIHTTHELAKTMMYQHPTVEDPTEEMTVQAFFPPEGSAKRYTVEDMEELKEEGDIDVQSKASVDSGSRNLASPSSTPKKNTVSNQELGNLTPNDGRVTKGGTRYTFSPRKTILDILQRIESTRIPCPWPKCPAETDFESAPVLKKHLRDIHGIHEVFWTPLLHSDSTSVVRSVGDDQWVPGEILSEPTTVQGPKERAFVMRKSLSDRPSPRDPFAEARMQRLNAFKHSAKHGSMEGVQAKAENIMDQTQESPVKAKAKSRSPIHGPKPFSLLPEDCRPQPLHNQTVWQESEAEDELIVSPEPVSEPFIHTDLAQGSNSPQFSVPKSSLVPSYFLATANRFSAGAVKDLLSRQGSAPRPLPLFVYGSLMFPSIFRAKASRFTVAEGIYSTHLQRRLQTSSADWSHINESLQHAAEMMTPAVLRGYRRTEFGVDASIGAVENNKGSRSSTLTQQQDHSDGAPSFAPQTKGMVVFGISTEAFACLDHQYSTSPHETRGDPTRSPDQRESFPMVTRKKVEVTIFLADGKPQIIEAYVYYLRLHPNSSLHRNSWDLNKFVKSDYLRQWSRYGDNDKYDWIKEEGSLAKKMGMKYAMRGDELCDKVLRSDIDGINRLLADGYDVNASCRRFGTPLQAAVFNGKEEMVYMLMKHHRADPNIVGGKYHLPIIAAICEGHEDVIKTLLRYGANPRANAGSFTSPVYQAVSFGDVEITRLLLEKGAWLSKDFQELLDVATEAGNSELLTLLKDYDVRKLHKSKKEIEEPNKHPPRSADREASSERLTLALRKRYLPALAEIIRLKGQKGKWTGIKLISVLRVAYANDIPNNVINFLGENLGSVSVMELISRETSLETIESRRMNRGDEHRQTKALEHCSSSSSDTEIPNADHSRRRTRPRRDVEKTNTEYKRPPLTNEPIDWISEDEDIFCLTCDGRGGRKGTGRPCTHCRGDGSMTQPDRSGRRTSKTCKPCNGSGRTYSERDVCRACNGGHKRTTRDRSDSRSSQHVDSRTKGGSHTSGGRSAKQSPNHNSSPRQRREQERNPPVDTWRSRDSLGPPPPYPGR